MSFSFHFRHDVTQQKNYFRQISIGTEPLGAARVAHRETPFRIAVLGDFCAGSASSSSLPAGEIAELKTHLIDRDNFAKVFQQLSVSLDVTAPGGGSPCTLHFRSLDDFHPDQLFAGASVFAHLRGLREQLLDSSTYAQAAVEVGTLAAAAGSPMSERDSPGESQPTSEQGVTPTEGGGILDQTVAATESDVPSSREADDIRRMVRAIVKPYSLPGPDPKQKELVAFVDHLAAELMSHVLHLPQFQALEATWRGIHFLTRRLETGTTLKVFIANLPKQALVADVLAHEELTATRLYKTLVEPSVGTLGGEPWALWVGDYTFDRTLEDIEALGRIAKLSAAAGAPFVSAASPHFVGCESLAETPDPHEWEAAVDPEIDEAWRALRRLPDAAYLGLALPRFLLRQPYGRNTSPIKSFDFEEMAEVPNHAHYLWGNSALACAVLLGDAFCQDSWNLRPDALGVLDRLPVHIYTADGQKETKPCAETWLTNRAGDAILSQGLMPVLSIKGQDAVQLARCQSVADPATPLAGRWRG